MNQFTVSVTLVDGSRSSYTTPASDGFAAANDAIERYGDLAIKRVAAINVRPALPSTPQAVHLPVVCVEGYKGPGV